MARFRLTSPRIKVAENDVERACLDFLRWRRYRPVRLHSGLLKTPDGRWIRVGEPGLPDYIVAHGKVPCFFLEVKRPGGHLSAEQQTKISELCQSYGLAAVVVDGVEALAAWVKQHEADHATRG